MTYIDRDNIYPLIILLFTNIKSFSNITIISLFTFYINYAKIKLPIR